MYALYRNNKIVAGQQKLLLEAVIETQEKERFRISQELHDNVGDALSGMQIELNHINSETDINKFPDIIRHLTDHHHNARTGLKAAIEDLSPFNINHPNWIVALEKCYKQLERTGILVNTSVIGIEQEFSAISQLNLYRILQELVNNTRKHSKAKEVYISYKYSPNAFEIEFSDDGVGFDFSKETTKGFGMNSIKSRVSMLKGQLNLKSELNKGTFWHFEFLLANLK